MYENIPYDKQMTVYIIEENAACAHGDMCGIARGTQCTDTLLCHYEQWQIIAHTDSIMRYYRMI